MKLTPSELKDLNTHLARQVHGVLLAHQNLVGEENVASGLIATMVLVQGLLLVVSGDFKEDDATIRDACRETSNFVCEHVLAGLKGARRK